MFDLAIAPTGLLPQRNKTHAKQDATPVTVGLTNDARPTYTTVPLLSTLTEDRRTGRLLGGQILNDRRAEISKQIDIIATAIFQKPASTISTISIMATLRRSAAHGIRSRWRRLGAPTPHGSI